MADAVRYLIAVVCLALAGAGSLSGAPASGSAGPVQQVRFTVYSARPISDVGLAVRAGAAPQKVTFYPTARSPRYEYRGTMPLRFVDPTSGEVVAEAVIPSGIRDALLLFSPATADAAGKAGTLRYQIAVLDDSAARQGSGALAIINLSGLELSGTIGKDAVTLRAGLNPAVAIGRSAKIMFRTAVKGRSYQAYANTVQLAPRERALLILFPPYTKGSVEVQARLLIDTPPGAATK